MPYLAVFGRMPPKALPALGSSTSSGTQSTLMCRVALSLPPTGAGPEASSSRSSCSAGTPSRMSQTSSSASQVSSLEEKMQRVANDVVSKKLAGKRRAEPIKVNHATNLKLRLLTLPNIGVHVLAEFTVRPRVEIELREMQKSSKRQRYTKAEKTAILQRRRQPAPAKQRRLSSVGRASTRCAR